MKAFLIFLFFAGSVFANEELQIKADKNIVLWPDRPPRDDLRHYARRKHGITRLVRVDGPILELYQAPTRDLPAPAVVICPGGAYFNLAYDLEGTEIAKWLNSQGITALILRYTVPTNPDLALLDAQRAFGLVRHHAADWKILPDKIGIIGFSAGGHLAARLSTNWRDRAYHYIDEADNENIRPDFAALIYPTFISPKDKYEISAGISVDDRTPPTFLVHTRDDPKSTSSAQVYFEALKSADVEAELHVYNGGGHGYGMRPSEHDVSEWPVAYKTWLTKILNK